MKRFSSRETSRLLALAVMATSGAALSCGSVENHPARSPEAAQATTADEDEPPSPTSMDPDKLSYALRGNEDDFRKCLMKSMGSRGTVTTQFRVAQNGEVSGARVIGGTIHDDSVKSCLVQELLTQNFSNQRQVSNNLYTFVFRLTDPIDKRKRQKLLDRADRQSGEALKLMPGSKGEIDLNHVAEIVQARFPVYAHCYRDSIRRRGESRGLVRFILHIDARGHVDEIEDDGSVLPDPYAVDCMAEGFYLMAFDPPTGGEVTVRYSLELQ